jgi:glycosyltransferase involved in cell wall biosynthesis
MKVLKIREFTYPTYVGGIETCLKELCPKLSEKGVNVTLMTCADRNLPAHTIEHGVETIRLDFMKIISSLTSNLKKRGIIYGMMARAIFLLILPLYLSKFVKEKNIDILHVHCLSALSALTTSLTGRLTNKIILITIHGTFLKHYPEILPFPVNLLVYASEKTYIQHANYAMILVEDAYTMEILLKLGVPKGKIEVLPYPGVDLSKFKKTKSKKTSEEIIIFHHGRLVKKRGIDYLINALPEVVKSFPNVKLVIAGDGPEKEKLTKLASHINVSKHVEFKGIVPHDKLADLIQQSDIIVIPSIIEGHSKSLLEAMAVGKTVIATNVGGIAEVVKDNENGLLVEPKNHDQISNAILKILKDKKLAEKLGRNALKTAKDFNIEILAEREAYTYKKIIKQLR